MIWFLIVEEVQPLFLEMFPSQLEAHEKGF